MVFYVVSFVLLLIALLPLGILIVCESKVVYFAAGVFLAVIISSIGFLWGLLFEFGSAWTGGTAFGPWELFGLVFGISFVLVLIGGGLKYSR